MGGCWITEPISWLIGGPPWIWYFTDIINLSRGVIIFYFCVLSNKKVRKSVLVFFELRFKAFDIRKKSTSTEDTQMTSRPNPSLAREILNCEKQDTPI
jgi:hypothetical protein